MWCAAAAFRLAADDVVPLNEAWAYVAERPARAAGLADRGVLATGKRADLIAVDGSDARRPKLVAAMAKGRFVHLAETGRLQ
jgi:alpha-D-ribose 1-methylphosphonate 5-triphosphate diphosphatase